jgi:hypothetical protein
MPTSLLGKSFVAFLLFSIEITGSVADTIFKDGFEFPANMLVFTQAPDTLIIGTNPSTSDVLIIQRQNVLGDPVSDGLLIVTVSSNSPGGDFDTSHFFPNPQLSLQLPIGDGSDSVQFFYRDSNLSTAIITAESTLPINGTHEIEMILP